ncbi:hypothetical protein PEC301879_10290 [Pectobacterium carotovorum subsp. carotovorum]|nr:hypothetical protein KHDHEBDM_01325 [Pectobacterium polaris]GKV88573.1 hypothetical protein PEC301619_05550 [Pectobacterium carotovorum subsp. carotovorum]GKW06560.1 hypothetical protein PEC301889_10430 [Pectobacterium carotovorum subsp. carotovorum]GKW37124.1 hypothetical protein PEC301875_11480 [Pectobacterium carotovorum subsp. carotovorum]GKW41170.1 hypothetical protein PEC301879_10290 [Pectobacterium carotovorum subsp. carotovorum]
MEPCEQFLINRNTVLIDYIALLTLSSCTQYRKCDQSRNVVLIFFKKGFWQEKES